MGVQDERYELGRYNNLPYMSSSCGRALSLLSSQQQWLNSTLPSRSSASASAALRELIAENRAQVLSRPYSDGSSQYQRALMVHPLSIQEENQEKCRLMPGLKSLENHAKVVNDGEAMKKLTGNPNTIVVRPTLDLMQQSDSLFALQSGKNNSNNKSSSSASSSSEDCEIWKSLEGTHIS